jgi:hypothetical protein
MVLRTGTDRWFRYLFWKRRTRRFGIYDLAAALCAIDDAGFAFKETPARCARTRSSSLDAERVRWKVCRALDRKLLWQRFLSIVQ